MHNAPLVELTAATHPSRIAVLSFHSAPVNTQAIAVSPLFLLSTFFSVAFWVIPLFLHFWYTIPPCYSYALGDLDGYLPHRSSLLERGASSACVVEMPVDLARSIYGNERAN